MRTPPVVHKQRTALSLSLSLSNMGVNEDGVGQVFRTDMGFSYHHHHHPYTDMEKRQLFLRSYQFSRKKKSVTERTKGSFFRVKRLIWVRLRSANKIRKSVWFRLRHLSLFYATRQRSFLRLHNPNNAATNYNPSSSSCFSW